MYVIKAILPLFVFLFIGGGAIAQSANAKAAKAFGLEVIQHYFKKDCTHFYEHLADEIISFESGQSFKKTASMKKMICAESPLRPDMKVTYLDYTENYAPTVYTKAVVEERFPGWARHLNMQKGDLFFDGAVPKAAGYKRVFRAADMARFVVRKKGASWVIIAI